MGCEESIIDYQHSLNSDQHVKGSTNKKIGNRARAKKTASCRDLELAEGKFTVGEEDWDMVERTLLSHHLLFKAKGYANREISSNLQCFEAKAQQVIFRKGDPSNYFFIILQGAVIISEWAEEGQDKILRRGEYFGDLGIQNKAPRSATAICKVNTKLLGLKRDNFLRVSLQLSRKAHNEVFKQIKTMPAFKHLSLQQKHKISYLAQQIRFSKGGVIFKKGQISNSFFIIKIGKVRIQIPGKQSLELKSRQIFGQSCLQQTQSVRLADAVCTQQTILLSFSRFDIMRYLGSQLFELQITNKLLWAIKHQKSLKLSPIVIQNMIDFREIAYFKDGEMIAPRGSLIKHFIICLQNSINNGPELQVINIDYLIDLKYTTRDLIKTGDGRIALLGINAIQTKFKRRFDSLLDLDHAIWKEIQSYHKIQQYVKILTLNNFLVIQTCGVGQYGPTLRIKTESNIQFAMKVIDKSKVINAKIQKQILMLKQVSSKMTHNLIAKHYRTFSDDYRVYFLNKLIEGQDLFDLVSKQGKLSLSVVKHFAACIISMMEYLHCRHVLWRQLKIESFVIDKQGYLNLIDLLYLEELPQDQAMLQNPTKATVYYLAPETLAAKGHCYQSDLWSLGVLVYRLIVGQFPYGAKLNSQGNDILLKLSQQIKKKGLQLPSWLTADIKMFLKTLLNPNQLQRSMISIAKLKSSTFFNDYDWLGLAQKRVKNIPYLPKKSQAAKIDPIYLNTWIDYQQSQKPPSSSLDEWQIIQQLSDNQ